MIYILCTYLRTEMVNYMVQHFFYFRNMPTYHQILLENMSNIRSYYSWLVCIWFIINFYFTFKYNFCEGKTFFFLLLMKHFIPLNSMLRDLLPPLQDSFHFLIPNMFENTFAHCVWLTICIGVLFTPSPSSTYCPENIVERNFTV